MFNYNEEDLVKAKQAKSVEELLTLAKENGVEVTAEQAQDIFAKLNQKSGELADDELDNVAGGGCYNKGNLVVSQFYCCDLWTCNICGSHIVPKEEWGDVWCICGSTGYHCNHCSYCDYTGQHICTNPSNKQ